jgi:hypothetical protein
VAPAIGTCVSCPRISRSCLLGHFLRSLFTVGRQRGVAGHHSRVSVQDPDQRDGRPQRRAPKFDERRARQIIRNWADAGDNARQIVGDSVGMGDRLKRIVVSRLPDPRVVVCLDPPRPVMEGVALLLPQFARAPFRSLFLERRPDPRTNVLRWFPCVSAGQSCIVNLMGFALMCRAGSVGFFVQWLCHKYCMLVAGVNE